MDAPVVAHAPNITPQADLKLDLVLCPVCGADEAEPIAVGEDFVLGTTRETFLAGCCRSCGLVYLNPRPAAEVRSRLYPAGYFSPAGWGDPALRWAQRAAGAAVRRALRSWVPLAADARLLEVGYGANLHLSEIRRAGTPTWVVEAVTPHETLARSAQRTGFMVYQGHARTLEVHGPVYDTVLLLHSLEHCEAPLDEMVSLHRLLRPGGRVVILTENVDSVVCSVFRGRHWAGYDFPRHSSLFGARVLRRLAGEAGFEVERVTTIASPEVWVCSTGNLLADWGAPAWLVRWVRPRSLVLTGLGSLVDRVCCWRGRGAQLEAVLRKPEEARE